ncbi:MAG: SH3 domain-containing protein [Lachnospiraceae bacterium]|nr:SH3 domain-containing protein [Lachnospiraceae bacterium]
MSRKIGITLDPGHSMHYNAGCVSGYYESDVMYDLSLYLADELKKYGIFEVYTTKEKLDTCPSLEARGKMAISNHSRCFISLHSNAVGASGGTAYGVVAFHSVKRKSHDFVNGILEELKKLFNENGSPKTNNRGAKTMTNSYGTDYYGVIRNAASSDGVEHIMLIEHGFHTTQSECRLLYNNDFVKKMAEVEAKCIYDEFKKYYVSDDQKTVTLTVTEAVNVRTGPSTSNVKLGTLSKGTKVEVIAEESGWYRIVWNGAAAYSSANYFTKPTTALPGNTSKLPVIAETPVTKPEPIPASDKHELVGYGTVTASDGLNVRTGPGTSFTKIGLLMVGASMDVYKTSVKNWYAIDYISGNQTVTGYICADYVKLQGIDTARMATVSTPAGLNVRSKPNQYTGKKLDTLPQGTKVYVVPDNMPNDGWVRVIYESEWDNYLAGEAIVEKFVKESYLTYSEKEVLEGNISEAVLTGKMPIGFGIIQVGLNVRTGPGTNYKKITTLSKGTGVAITGHVDGWAQILYNGDIAYVSEDEAYLKITTDIGYVLDKPEFDPGILEKVQELPQVTATTWLSSILKGRLTSPYGVRIHPITKVQSMHWGIDIGANGGTPIYATVDGFVMTNAYDANGYGNYLCIVAVDGTKHYYAHMKSAGIPKVGDLVYAGMKIGYVGTTGASTGNHLHYEIRKTDNSRIAPDDYQFNTSINLQVENTDA